MAILSVEIKSEEKSLFDVLIAQAKSKSPKKVEEDDDDDEDEKPAPKKSGKSSKEDDDEDDIDDDWSKEDDEEEEWDPDFEEFDLPKSKGKKAVGIGTKPAAEEEEDFKVDDDELKDLFNDSGLDDDEEDDF